MNDTAPSQGPRIYRLRTLIAVAAASMILGFALARFIPCLRPPPIPQSRRCKPHPVHLPPTFRGMS